MHYIKNFTFPTSTTSRGLFSDSLSRLILDTFPEYAELKAEWGDEKKTNEPVVFTVELPGYAKSDVSVSLDHENVLSIVAENVKRGKTERRYFVSDEIDGAAITANCENGILTVTLPRVKQPEPRKIVVA